MEIIRNGLTLANLEQILCFSILIRFFVLTLRYNLKTSFYIVGIGMVAAGFWYRHLIEVVEGYYYYTPDIESLNFLAQFQDNPPTESPENFHWFNIGRILFYAFENGLVHTDPSTGIEYQIDPVSILISGLSEATQENVLPLYYRVYHSVIPTVVGLFIQFWDQFFEISLYIFLTRLGKRYCPYLIRWHWTFVLLLGFIEPMILFPLTQRIAYFIDFVIPERVGAIPVDPLTIQPLIAFLEETGVPILQVAILLSHVNLLIFGLIHAIWGQYFYFPFLVESTELHVGRRPANSIYSLGKTAWQNPAEIPDRTNQKFWFPKLWYGWLGRGTVNTPSLLPSFRTIRRKIRGGIQRIKKIISELLGTP